MSSQLLTYARALHALGPQNVARVASYRLGIKTGVHPVLRLRGAHPRTQKPYFSATRRIVREGLHPRQQVSGSITAFGHILVPCGIKPPDWHRSVLTGTKAQADQPWHRIGAFSAALGDIKGVWELSRFDWLLGMAQRAAAGDADELERLNLWIADWVQSNPAYLGSNWMCGQEASIRVLHLATAALLLDQVEAPLPGLIELVTAHLRRIAPTMSYAVGQDNNHGTSEAAALFVGGTWLESLGGSEGSKWAAIGRQRLAERATRLIEADGSFSQYSTVYHRVVLDTYSFAETWRRRLGLAAFPSEQQSRLAAATRWLHQMVDRLSGDAPNLGANDGAWLFVLEDSDYRDFRPSLQWAAALFLDRRAIAYDGLWDQRLLWLGVDRPALPLEPPKSRSFGDGGYHVARCGRAVAYMRYPRYRFRPSQADALHVDLWVDGENLLRDGGTLSYNASAADTDYFGGTASHNTVMFDGRDQMPRLSRFLFGMWLPRFPALLAEDGSSSVNASAEYTDHRGATHRRELRLQDSRLTVTDTLDGNAKQAVLRWRLAPGDWVLQGDSIRSGRRAVQFMSRGSDPPRVTLSEGQESRYYARKTVLPVAEVSVSVPARIVTEFEF